MLTREQVSELLGPGVPESKVDSLLELVDRSALPSGSAASLGDAELVDRAALPSGSAASPDDAELVDACAQLTALRHEASGADTLAPELSPQRMLDDAARALGWRTDLALGGSPITWEAVLLEIQSLAWAREEVRSPRSGKIRFPHEGEAPLYVAINGFVSRSDAEVISQINFFADRGDASTGIQLPPGREASPYVSIGGFISPSDAETMSRISLLSADCVNASAREPRGGDPEALHRSINELELSVRTAHCLERAGIRTIGELVSKTPEEILLIKWSGRKVVKNVAEALAPYGLTLKERLPKARSEEESRPRVQWPRVAAELDQLERALGVMPTGWCPWPYLGLRPVGRVNGAGKAECRCGKRVRITTNRLLVHHKMLYRQSESDVRRSVDVPVRLSSGAAVTIERDAPVRGAVVGASDPCVCGHAPEDHGRDPEYPGSTACRECVTDGCVAYEADPVDP